jgi:hypothetical protein
MTTLRAPMTELQKELCQISVYIYRTVILYRYHLIFENVYNLACRLSYYNAISGDDYAECVNKSGVVRCVKRITC